MEKEKWLINFNFQDMKVFWEKFLKISLIFVLVLGLSMTGFAQKNKKDKEKPKGQNKGTNENVFVADSENSKTEAEYYFSEGMKFFILEDYEKAIEQFQKALVLSGGNAGINYKIAETYLRLKNLPQAEMYAEAAIENGGNNKYYYTLLANVYANQKKYDNAIRTYQKMIETKLGGVEYNYEIAELYLRQDNNSKAIEAFDNLEKVYGINESITQQKQRIYLKSNQIDKAIQEGQKLIQAFPDENRHVISLAELLINSQRSAEALSILEKAAQNQSYDPRIYLLLAQIYQKEGKLTEALNYLKIAFQNPELEANPKINWMIAFVQEKDAPSYQSDLTELAESIVKVHPDNPQAYTVLADVWLLRNDKNNALENYQKAVRLDNSKAELWQRVLGLEADLRKLDSLIKHSEAALELFPNQGVFWMYNGMGYLGKKNYQKAVEAFEEGKRLAFNDQELLGDFNLRLGDSYNGLKQYAESDAAFEDVLRLQPTNPYALNNYSYYLALRKEKLELAKELAERLTNSYPDNATFLDTYGWVLYTAKDYKKARKIFEKAVQSASSGTIIEHYGDVLYKLGEEESAIQQWEKAKKMGGTTQLIDKKIADKKLYE
jgi:tetratricopeptide (TPR) repeat protein